MSTDHTHHVDLQEQLRRHLERQLAAVRSHDDVSLSRPPLRLPEETMPKTAHRRRLAGAVVAALVGACCMTSGAAAQVAGRNGAIAYTSSRDIVALGADGVVRNLTPSADTGGSDPVYSPDGRQIAYLRYDLATDDPPQLSIMQADGSDSHPVLPSISEIDPPLRWSPDGRQLVVSHDVSGGRALSIVDLTTGTARLLTAGNGTYDSTPAWSPDGRWVVFFRSSAQGLLRVRTNGRNLQAFGPQRVGASFPDYSPDGATILFNSFDGLVVMNADGSDARAVGRILAPYATWSPNGKKILFQQGDSVVVMSARGRHLTTIASFAFDPSWQALPAAAGS